MNFLFVSKEGWWDVSILEQGEVLTWFNRLERENLRFGYESRKTCGLVLVMFA